jgi:hypothetical protein
VLLITRSIEGLNMDGFILMPAIAFLAAWHSVAGQDATIFDRARANPTATVVSGVVGDVPTPPLEILVKEAPLVLEATLSAERSYLSKDQTYITTEYVINPTRTLSGQLSTTSAQRPGETFAPMLVVRGGSWVVDGRVVWDVNYNRERLKTGVTYLLFLKPVANQPGKHNLYATGGFEVQDGRLTTPLATHSRDKYEDLMAKPYQEVLDAITVAAKQK